MSVAEVALRPIRQESAAKILGPFGGSSDSVVIYLKIAGAMVPMCVSESDPISAVKLWIQRCRGMVVKNQRLVSRGRELARNNCLVKDYGIRAGNLLHLVLRISDILSVTVRADSGEELRLHVNRHQSVGYLRRQITRKAANAGGFDGGEELFFDGERLADDEHLIGDICKEGSDTVLRLLLVNKSAKPYPRVSKALDLLRVPKRDFWLKPLVNCNPEIGLPPLISELVRCTSDGLEAGKRPIRSSEGSGGAYLMQDRLGHRYVSVFKPIDEEPNAVNNPQGLPPSIEGLKRGTRVGEGALREVAAYLLDHPVGGPRSVADAAAVIGFSGVPPTAMVECLHDGFNHPGGYGGSPENVKVGSLQVFVKNSGSCEDMGPRDFPVEEVHKISVMDIRMANADRHAGNILVTRGEDGQIVLVPIDHGYCLPENFEDCTLDWLYWPQAKQPYAAATIDYIKSLDAEQDIELLKFYGLELSPECARTLRISTMLLKKGVERGLSPFAIGSIMVRETLNQESIIEEMVREAQDGVLPGTSEAGFLEAISLVMDYKLDKLVQ